MESVILGAMCGGLFAAGAYYAGERRMIGALMGAFFAFAIVYYFGK